MHITQKTQIKTLFLNKVFIIILMDYSNYDNVFSTKNIIEFL